MTTLIVMFVLAFVLALGLTPAVRRLGIRFNAMDVPNERKVHTQPIPRTGGVAVFTAFILVFLASGLYRTDITGLIVWDRQLFCILAGACITFGIGLADDFMQLGPKIKLLFQIAGASVAFAGGARIDIFPLLEVRIPWAVLSYGVTVFWFLLFINAVNLVDGLDGLAGGIVVFASLVITILSTVKGAFETAVYFAILGGAVLGFLRYNFNPASVFLGDGGSYFLGYCIACFSVLGSVKAQTSAAMAIPVLALGVPLFDTILAPLRRFARGQKMFRPDRRHLHHRLIQKGLNTRNAVLLIYGLTLALCLSAVVLTNIRDEQAGFFLVVLGLGGAIVVRKLGFFEHVKTYNLFRWVKDVGDQAGVSFNRRRFFSYQANIFYADGVERLWEGIREAADFLDIDFIELKLTDRATDKAAERSPKHTFTSGTLKTEFMNRCNTIRISLPLATNDYEFGSLDIAKLAYVCPVTPFTLRRIEQLRRSVLEALIRIKDENGGKIGGRKDLVRNFEDIHDRPVAGR